MKINIEGNLITTTADSDLHVVISGARGPQGEPSPLGVPYTGATQDVNLGEFGLQTGNIEFDNTPTNTPTTDGSLYWDDTSGTLSLRLKGGNVISKVGETQHIRAYNDTGNPIAKGKVVYVTGAQGQRLTIDLADADTELLSKDTIGITAEAIEDGAEGFVIVAGILTNINTNGLADGDTVYLSQTAGSYTNVAPADPAHLVILGFVVNGNSGGAGSIYVKVDNGYELEELHNVSDAAKTSVVDNDAFLLRDSADNNLWKRLTWSNLKTAVKTYLDTFKGVAGGYASLDGSGKVPSSELPSYVDDVIEVANYAALPVTGETGKIYVTLDDSKVYRWSGSVYIQIVGATAWGSITGTLSNQTDLQTALNAKQDTLTNPVTGTGASGQVSYWTGTGTQGGSNNLFWDNANVRLGIGLNTGLTARTHIRGSGTTSATTALLVQNSGASALLTVTDDGTVTVANKNIVASGILAVGGTVSIKSNLAAVTGNYLILDNNNVNITTTTSQVQHTRILSTYSPTSGTGVFIQVAINSTINQTGGANGITRGLYVNPTLTSAADWRSIEFSNNTGWGIYGAGTANNYLAGSLGIGTTSLTAVSLKITKTITGATNSTGVSQEGIVNSDVTSIGIGFNNILSTTQSSFNLNSYRHFFANQGSIRLGSSVTNQSGFHVSSTLIDATNNYAFQGEIPSGTGRWNLYMNGTAANYLAGNTSIGTTTSSGRLTVRGSGTTSATTALLVQNSTPTDILTVRDDNRVIAHGGIFTGGASTIAGLFPQGTLNQESLLIRSSVLPTATGVDDIRLTNGQGDVANTTGTRTLVNISRNFSPTSGSGNYNLLWISPTINQTGGANGITRGLYVNPTLTSAADWRGIESVAASNANHTLLKLRNATVDVFTVKSDSKIGFFNATPVAQPTTGIAEAAFVENLGGTFVNVDSTFDGYTMQQVVKALKDIGILA